MKEPFFLGRAINKIMQSWRIFTGLKSLNPNRSLERFLSRYIWRQLPNEGIPQHSESTPGVSAAHRRANSTTSKLNRVQALT